MLVKRLVKKNVYFSAIDQETGEEKLFSVSEILSEEEYLERLYKEREFSSKEQKALRKLWDLNQGLLLADPRVRSGEVKLKKEVDDKARSIGRKITKHVPSTPRNLNEKIELKRVTPQITTVADLTRSPEFTGQNFKDYKTSKERRKYYDHGKRDNSVAMDLVKKRT